jgi:glycine/D-amino acid oxidase-like deaminating enzyme
VKNVDYIVVGLGIAGLCICEQLEKHKKKFVVFDTAKNGSTLVSGGIFNPVILKRFTIAWKAKEHMAHTLGFYKALSEKLGVSILNEQPILRILTGVEEQNDWAVASDRNELAPFLSSEVITNNNLNVIAPFGFGKVNSTGRIYPSVLLEAYRAYLQKENILISEEFDYKQLSSEATRLVYNGITAKKILFAEGAAVFNNPFFPRQFIIANKGEFLIVRAPELKLDVLLKGAVYIIPLRNALFKVGATYYRDEETHTITGQARDEIIGKLKKMISCDFEVIEQEVGIRPTTKDRKPLLGSLPQSENKVFFNGLGTHGVLTAPFLSEILYKSLEDGLELPGEMDIRRMIN